MARDVSLLPEIGPDCLPREAPVITYTERIIKEEQDQLNKVEEVFPLVSFNFLEGASLIRKITFSMIMKPKDYRFYDGNQWCIGFPQSGGRRYHSFWRHVYGLNLEGIAVWGSQLAIDTKVFGMTYVDPGTHLVILAEEAYDFFISYFTRIVSPYSVPVVANGHQCFQVSSRIEELFPPVSFIFLEGAEMVLKPKDYLIFDGIQWCIGFQKEEGRSITIIGELALKDKAVVYDQGRQRLGWTDYDCLQPVNVTVEAHGSGSSLLVDRFSESILINIIAFFGYIYMFV